MKCVVLVAVLACVMATERMRDLPIEECLNGGHVVDGECECTLQFEGARCEIEVCQNGGQVHIDRFSKKRCYCPYGVTGEKCQSVTYCESGKGELVDGKCKCKDRWTGIFCQTRTCHNGVETADRLCTCDKGFTGPFCDEVFICENGGAVNDLNECDCEGGWSGSNCELCEDGKHIEGSMCIQEVSGQSMLSSTPSLLDWPALVAVGCALLVLIAVISISCVVVRKWKTKPSRVSSAQGEPVGTDV